MALVNLGLTLILLILLIVLPHDVPPYVLGDPNLVCQRSIFYSELLACQL